mgnify:FL=1
MPLFITINIVTTPAYFPAENGNADNEYQHLMETLGRYFPQLVAQVLNDTYTELLNLDTENIVVDEFRLAHPGEITHDGVLIYIRFPRQAPSETLRAELHSELARGIRTWFREGHGLEPPEFALELLWHEPNTAC